MAFISKVIKKRISNLISRFDVPKIPPHMINQLEVEKEATSTKLEFKTTHFKVKSFHYGLIDFS